MQLYQNTELYMEFRLKIYIHYIHTVIIFTVTNNQTQSNNIVQQKYNDYSLSMSILIFDKIHHPHKQAVAYEQQLAISRRKCG